MMRYAAHIQGAIGCDYSIGCGSKVVLIDADSFEHAAEQVLERYGDVLLSRYDSDLVQRITIYEAAEPFEVDFGRLHREAHRRPASRRGWGRRSCGAGAIRALEGKVWGEALRLLPRSCPVPRPPRGVLGLAMRYFPGVIFLGNGDYSKRMRELLHARLDEALDLSGGLQQSSQGQPEDDAVTAKLESELEDAARDIVAAVMGRDIEIKGKTPYPYCHGAIADYAEQVDAKARKRKGRP